MAKATFVPPTPVKQGVILELNYEEAQALFALTGRVGGSSVDSPRKFTSEVYEALSGLLNTESGFSDYQGLLNGDSLYFKNF
jgi:hypothetical protein